VRTQRFREGKTIHRVNLIKLKKYKMIVQVQSCFGGLAMSCPVWLLIDKQSIGWAFFVKRKMPNLRARK